MRPGPGTPLRDRQVDYGDGRDPPPIPAHGSASPEKAMWVSTGRRRHCWVLGPPTDPGPHAGLLLGWHHHGATGQWQGFAVYVVDEGGPTAATVQAWLPATQLKPA